VNNRRVLPLMDKGKTLSPKIEGFAIYKKCHGHVENMAQFFVKFDISLSNQAVFEFLGKPIY